MTRWRRLLTVGWIVVLVAGCKAPQKQPPVSQGVKIQDIAPANKSRQPDLQALGAMAFDIHIIELPVDNIGELAAVWRALGEEPLKFTSHGAFVDNGFKIGIGSQADFGKVHRHLLDAGGSRAALIRLLLAQGETGALNIVPLTVKQTIGFTSSTNDRQRATLGVGMFGLRLKAQRVRETRGVCTLTAYPAFWLPMSSPIPELAERAGASEFVFDGAAFGTRMTAGQMVVLGPAGYSDQSTLAGLLFCRQAETMFFGVVRRKAFVRVLLIVCTGMSD